VRPDRCWRAGLSIIFTVIYSSSPTLLPVDSSPAARSKYKREKGKEKKEKRKGGMKRRIIKARGEDIRSPGGRADRGYRKLGKFSRAEYSVTSCISFRVRTTT
jgi:hypothetical protein